MKNNKSILGGGIAERLLDQLTGKPVGFVARTQFSNVDCALRKSYRYQHGKWNGFTHETSKYATGGMLLDLRANKRFDCVKDLRKKVRLTPKQAENPKHYICIAITNFARANAQENLRAQAVSKMDAIARPHIENKAFLKWVEKREKIAGESCYDTLTREQAEDWINAILKWEKQ